MASTTGTVTTSPEQHQRSLTLTWSQTSQSVANNTTTISWTLKGSGSDTQYYWVTCRKIKVTINGTQAFYQAAEVDVNNGMTVASGSFTIPHNNDGTKTFSIAVEASIYEVSINSTGSGSWTLTSIPRYATVSQSLSSKTETTITMAWTSDSTVDYIWYQVGSGSWVGIDVADGKSGTYTISGRSAGTAYSIKTRVRRKDSQLTTDSSALSVTTYNYPYATSMPNFTIGNSVTVKIYNPLGRTCTLLMLGAGDASIGSRTISGGTSTTGWNSSGAVSALYASIPSAKSGTYKISVTYSGHTETRTGGTYSCSEANCKPTMGTVDYVDQNSTTIAVTGDSSKIVRSLSSVRFRAQTLSAKNSATVSSCKVTVLGTDYSMSISGTTATKTGVTIDSGSNITVTFTLTDSRGFTATKTLSVTMLNWQNPTGIITLQRHDNYYSETDLKCDGSISAIGSNAMTISYKCRRTGTSSWTLTGTLTDNVVTTLTMSNTYAWDVWVTIEDTLGGTTTYKLVLSRGMPIAYFDRIRNSVGVDCFPAHDGELEVGGSQVVTKAQMPFVGKQKYMDNNTSIAFTVESSSQFVIFFTSAYVAGRGGIVGMANSSGSVYYTALGTAPSGISITTATNKLTCVNTSGGGVFYNIIVFGGDVTIPT